MIPVNDLRTGNWIFDSNSDFKKLETGADLDKAANYTPIPITREILIHCGFRYDTYFNVWQLKKNALATGYEMEVDSTYNVRDFGHRYVGIKLETLHQLQNLYYSMKQEELPLNTLTRNFSTVAAEKFSTN